jgi:hypothetical protein
MASLKMVSQFSICICIIRLRIFRFSTSYIESIDPDPSATNVHFAQIVLWAFLVVLVAAVNAAPRYFIIDDGEEGKQ